MNEGTGIPLHTRAKHDAIDHGEDADIETETERQRKHRRQGKAGFAGEGPDRVAKILAHMDEDNRRGRLLTVPSRHGWIGVTGRSETGRSKVWKEVGTGFCREIPFQPAKGQRSARYDNVVRPLRPEYAQPEVGQGCHWAV